MSSSRAVTLGAPPDEPAPAPKPSGAVAVDGSRHASGDLAGALHEVSNALTVLIGWVERAREPGASRAEIDRALEIAGARATLARDVVRRAIGAEVPDDADSTVESALGDALIGLEPEARRKELAVSLSVDADIAAFTLPQGSKVLQILTNLLLNAIAFTPRGGAIEVAAAQGAGRTVVMSVEDRGPGVPIERRATLLEDGVSTREGGAGVGLRHAAALARDAGGRLALADSSRGARFELSWPLGERGKKSSPPPRPKHLPLAGSRVLIVEDDEAVVDLLDMALTARGASVVSARDEKSLSAALATGPFNAALFDISPIQDDVVGALAAAKATSKDVRLVVISGTAVSLPALPPDWVTSWVRKPFEISEIVDAIEGATLTDSASAERRSAGR